MENTIKKIGIFSGKGGVGKTSITASLALLLSKKYKILAIDTDVDAPNLSILFDKNSSAVNSFPVKTTEKSFFSPEKCNQCKLCVTENFCNFDAIHWDSQQNIPTINYIACEGCNACALLCPQKAYTIKPVESGYIHQIHTKHSFDVITGETILGSQTSGKLVSELKTYALENAKSEKVELIILDGPPGIGCPVIAAITDLDFVLVVIEPTNAALHDATRLIEIINTFKIPHGVIINKADIFPDGFHLIKKYLEHNKIPIIGTIDLDSEWPNAISEGKPILTFRPDGPSSKSLKIISEKLIDLI